MVKKLQKTADKPAADSAPPAPTGLLDSQLAQTIKDSAHQIWLAGLGAFAKAQGGGGKVFETLMKEGVSLQRKTQTAAEEKLSDVAVKMTAMAGEVGQKANAQWDKLEGIFEQRTARALAKLGVPSAQTLADLGARLDALATTVARLQGLDAPATKPRFKPGKERTKKAAGAAALATAAVPAAAPKATTQPAVRKRAVKAATAPAVAAPAVAVKRRKAKAAAVKPQGASAATPASTPASTPAAAPATTPAAKPAPARRRKPQASAL